MANSSNMVVLDSTNLDAIVRDATGNGIEPVVLPTDSGKPVSAESPAPAEAPPPVKEPPPGDAPAEDPDDVEGDDGLTPREKRELTAKMQKAIGKRTIALREAEAFAADQYNGRRLAEQRAEQLDREINRLKTQLNGSQPPADPAAGAKPDRKNFETDQSYQDAIIDWQVDQRFKAKEAEQAQQRERERQAEVLAHAAARIERARELVPDFSEVTGAVDMAVPPYIAGYMQESDMFAELGYHFAKHPDVLEKLSKLTPAKALVEVGKIESTLTPFAASAVKVENGSKDPSAKPNGAATPAAKPNTETAVTPSKPRAAAPIKPLSSGSAVQVDKPENEMSVQEAMAAWQKKRQVNLNRRQRH